MNEYHNSVDQIHTPEHLQTNPAIFTLWNYQGFSLGTTKKQSFNGTRGQGGISTPRHMEAEETGCSSSFHIPMRHK